MDNYFWFILKIQLIVYDFVDAIVYTGMAPFGTSTKT